MISFNCELSCMCPFFMSLLCKACAISIMIIFCLTLCQDLKTVYLKAVHIARRILQGYMNSFKVTCAKVVASLHVQHIRDFEPIPGTHQVPGDVVIMGNSCNHQVACRCERMLVA